MEAEGERERERAGNHLPVASGRAEHAIAAGDLCTNSYRPTYRPTTTTERPMGGRVACPPSRRTPPPPQGEDVESSLSLSLATVASLSVSCYRPELSRRRRACPCRRARAPAPWRRLPFPSSSSVHLPPPSLSLSSPWFIRPLSLFGGGCLSERLPVRLSLSLSRWSPLLALPLPSSPTVQSRRGRRRVFLPRRTPKQQESHGRRRGVGRSRVSREDNQVCWCMVGTQDMRYPNSEG